MQTVSLEAWETQLSALLSKGAGTAARARAGHERWWTDFWNRSWLHISGSPEAAAAAATYAADAAYRVFMDVHQLHGAMGFTTDYDLYLWSTRLAVALRRRGTS